MLIDGCSVRPNSSVLIYGQYYLLETLLWLDAHDDSTPHASVGSGGY